MTEVSLDKRLAVELVDMKLNFIVNEIEKILSNWHYDVASKFLGDAEQGIFHEAENDAITLVHLLDQQDELIRLKGTWIDESTSQGV